MAEDLKFQYIIKTYEEGFVEDQAKIGTEATKNWSFHQQSTAKRLRQVYSLPNFNPSTRFYAFVKDEMVGFLTTTILEKENEPMTANLFLPLVKEGHEKAQEVLIKYALEALQEKGVEYVTTNLGENWGNGKELLNKFGFKHTEDVFHIVESEISAIDLSKLPEPKDVIEYDKNRDSDVFTSLMIELYGVPEDYAKQRVDQYNNRTVENLIVLVVARKDDKTVALCAANADKEPKVAGMSAILAKPNQELKSIRGQIFRSLIQECAKRGYEKIRFGVREKDLATREEEFSLLSLTPRPIISGFTKGLR
ncbi:MAG: hypothetical protein ACFFBD_10445 [Candidatus Hodarchaeota archaeon]